MASEGPTAGLDRTEAVWWAVSLLFATVAGAGLLLETGNLAVGAVIAAMTLGNGLCLQRWSS